MQDKYCQVVKYILFSGILYSIFKLTSIENKDNIKTYLIIGAIIISLYSLDSFISVKENMTDDTAVTEEEADELRNQIDTEVAEKKKLLEKQVHKETECLRLKNVLNNTRDELTSMRRELSSLKSIESNPENTEKYYNLLKEELLKKNIIDEIDALNYDAKLKSGFSHQDIIIKFEKLKKEGIILSSVNDFRFSELPEKAYEPLGKGISKWDDGKNYTQLNTVKWKPVDKGLFVNSIYVK